MTTIGASRVRVRPRIALVLVAALATVPLVVSVGALPVFVAFERDGEPLGDGEGMARLVVPGEKRGGRHVNLLTRIEIRDVGNMAASRP